jgi:hypothetical protein
MKTKELKQLLDQCDPESEVFISMCVGCCGDSKELTINEVDTMELASTAALREGKSSVALSVYVNPVEGYRTCRQSGATELAHAEYLKQHNIK